MPLRLRRFVALFKKELLQVIRDPSSILIAFVLPIILLFIFGFGLSLDAKHVSVGVVMYDRSPVARSLWSAFDATPYIDVTLYDNLRDAQESLVNAKNLAFLIVPDDFTRKLEREQRSAIQLVTDGTETNTAAIIENYVLGVVAKWSAHYSRDRGNSRVLMPVETVTRVYFNPELESRYALIPGSVVVIMSIIGTLLTSLIVSREWERGTMEAMLATPITPGDMIIGKLFPYYVIGIISTGICVLVSVFLFGMPFRGSVLALFLASSAFLWVALGQGFIISTLCKNQFLATQLSLAIAFLPSFVLSGAIFEISSMPDMIQVATRIFPARYFVTCLRTIFMTGDIWALLLPNILFMLTLGTVIFAITMKKTPKRLE